MSLAPSARLGPYEILAAIGAGGMGEVYRARDTRLDRTVAVKVLPAALAADAQFRERFQREARVVSQLSHSHICILHDVGEAVNPESPAGADDRFQFLGLEHIDGGTLVVNWQEELKRRPVHSFTDSLPQQDTTRKREQSDSQIPCSYPGTEWPVFY